MDGRLGEQKRNSSQRWGGVPAPIALGYMYNGSIKFQLHHSTNDRQPKHLRSRRT